MHHDDGPLLFWPLNWSNRYASPLSYWDMNNYAYIVMPVEGAIFLLLLGRIVWQWLRPDSLSE
ncbi:MAG: hypothetical protein VXZ82_02060 [Planctomycetota bacterium]|nr:hypothetical protein [Planctomycetota bacterium]